MYGNFDIILDHLSRIPRLYTTIHTPCAVFYLVPRLIGCWLGPTCDPMRCPNWGLQANDVCVEAIFAPGRQGLGGGGDGELGQSKHGVDVGDGAAAAIKGRINAADATETVPSAAAVTAPAGAAPHRLVIFLRFLTAIADASR